MFIFVLAAAVLVSAAILWYGQAFGAAEEEVPPPEEGAAARLRRALSGDPGAADALAGAVRALEAVMAHPGLGGPGTLTIQFPLAPGEGRAVVTAQYPNIREELYRRIVRRELEDLAAAGVPEALLALDPAFETESGGMVLVSVQVGGLPPELAEGLRDRRERNAALGVLGEALARRLPAFSVRAFGADLLLSPVRERDAISTGG